MLIEKLLDLGRIDVLPSSDDHILYASYNAAVSQTVQAGYVTVHTKNCISNNVLYTTVLQSHEWNSVSPSPVPVAWSDRLPGFLWLVPVPVHHTTASDQQLAWGPERDNHPSSSIHHFSLRSSHAKIQHVSEGCVKWRFAWERNDTSVWAVMHPAVVVFSSSLSSGNPINVRGLFSVVP